MALSPEFNEAVKTKNIRRIKIMMKDSLLLDTTFKDFEEMKIRALQDIPMNELYDKHDNRELIQDSSNWTKDYMNKLMVQVIGNFSEDRVEHLKKVVQYLYPPVNYTIQKEQVPTQKLRNFKSKKEKGDWLDTFKEKVSDLWSGKNKDLKQKRIRERKAEENKRRRR